jgi:hypothetical protein
MLSLGVRPLVIYYNSKFVTLEFVDSKGFQRWCKTLRIAGILDSVHRPVFLKLENTTFRKLDLFPSLRERGRDTYSVGSLRKS